MKINVISDLHCRTNKFPPSFSPGDLAPADVLVVAGDLGTERTYEKIRNRLREKTSGLFGSVICIKGNHDYYSAGLGSHEREAVKPSLLDNFTTSVSSGSETVDFICTPLWTPIRNDDLIRRGMNDYNYIVDFTPARSTELFWENLDWIERSVKVSENAGRKYVIVTHHLPMPCLIDPDYADSCLNEAFCVMDGNARKRIESLKPAIWIHGHSHNFMDTEHLGVRYVRNPYGYEWSTHDYSGGSKESTGYRNDFVVTI